MDKESHIKLYGKLDKIELEVRAELLRDELVEITKIEESRDLVKEEKDQFDEITDKLIYIKKRYLQLTGEELTLTQK